MDYNLSDVAAQFAIDGTLVESVPYGTGHINDTFLATFKFPRGTTCKYTFQRVNHSIFKDVPGLMQNFQRVTEHLRGKLEAESGRDPERETLRLIHGRDGLPYVRLENGDYWRVYLFVDGARTFDEVQSTDQAYQAAHAFGEFQRALMDLPEPPLNETIPDFHHTPARFEKLKAAVEADACGRARVASSDIEFAMAHEKMTPRVVEMLESGALPWRVTHNDTKINNVLIDDATGRGLCVIDLDTVMPGSVLYDFGDQIRTTTGTAAEDERDLGKVQFQLDMFESLVKGYLDAGRDFLTPAEVDLLAFSGSLITFEIGIRFLTDFLEGDVYFKTHREGHNLDRARTQFEMVRQMEEQAEAMQAIV
ncbi:MAG: aminoglycoside phosphotransferase family protein, partial [Lentisphaeria bacterium]|nr:aminoglycoside phosphotransferase family protein [Lentisphaeria bacterium]